MNVPGHVLERSGPVHSPVVSLCVLHIRVSPGSLDTVKQIPTLGALFSRGGPVQDPVLTRCTGKGFVPRTQYGTVKIVRQSSQMRQR